MADVAAAAGVSTALVSIVMRDVPGASDATRAHVLRIADQLGYVLDSRARQLRQRKSGLIGVTFELQQPFHGDLVDALYAAVGERGYDVVLSGVTPRRNETAAVAALLRERCEAVVLLGPRAPEIELAGLADRTPTLVMARALDVPKVFTVRTDDIIGIELAVDHLVSLGHSAIVHVDGARAPGSADRSGGFVARTRSAGLSGTCAVVAGGPTEADGARAAAAMLDGQWPGGEPTAVIAFNDRCAVGVMDVLLRHGVSVPERISVMGFDDSRLSRLTHVQLSTIAQDIEGMARAAVHGALAQINGADAERVVLAPTLVARTTTAPPPGR